MILSRIIYFNSSAAVATLSGIVMFLAIGFGSFLIYPLSFFRGASLTERIIGCLLTPLAWNGIEMYNVGRAAHPGRVPVLRGEHPLHRNGGRAVSDHGRLRLLLPVEPGKGGTRRHQGALTLFGPRLRLGDPGNLPQGSGMGRRGRIALPADRPLQEYLSLIHLTICCRRLRPDIQIISTTKSSPELAKGWNDTVVRSGIHLKKQRIRDPLHDRVTRSRIRILPMCPAGQGMAHRIDGVGERLIQVARPNHEFAQARRRGPAQRGYILDVTPVWGCSVEQIHRLGGQLYHGAPIL